MAVPRARGDPADMVFVFEELRVYRAAEECLVLAYQVAALLPAAERFNLAEQLRRAALSVVLNIADHHFEQVVDDRREEAGVELDAELSADDWRELIEEYKAIVKEDVGRAFPQDVHAQLWDAVGAVFGSWSNQRARTYRRLHNIPEEWGTAVNVQAMVFGNMGEDCATGVAFTRDPSTGDNDFYGEYLPNAQGEDVVAGIRTPQPLTEHSRHKNETDLPSMEQTMPEVYRQLCDVRAKLESHYLDMQDIEFTVQRGTLYMLQTRTGKRTAKAALKIAVDMVRDGLINQERAVQRVTPGSLDQLLHPTLDPEAEKDVISRGLPASPGAASGTIVFTADEAEQRAEAGEKVILCRVETSPEDIHGMHAAEGILTTRGGMTSHAAVVARGMGRPCVAGAGELRIDYKSGIMRVRDVQLKAGDTITIDGGSGEIMRGRVPTVEPKLSGDFAKVMEWADRTRRMRVRANAETPLDAKTARGFGAEGIGLCRTEHMFFEGERIDYMRQMILAGDELGNSQGGNNNAYNQDNEISWIDWADVDEDFLEFVRKLIAFRRNHPILRQKLFLHSRERLVDGEEDLFWSRPDGCAMTTRDWEDPDLQVICAELRTAAGTPPYDALDDAVFLVFNRGEAVRVKLPPPSSGRGWTWHIDTSRPDMPRRQARGRVDIAAHSVAAFVHGPSHA